MAGTFFKPKARGRKFAVNFGTVAAPAWHLICFGISSRGTDFSEDKEEYEYMCGGKDTEPTEQTVSRSFSGNRFIGDPAQDAIFIDRIFNMDNRHVQVYEWYDGQPAEITTAKGNGWSYDATITISDDGSGDAPERETIGFSLDINGTPKRGTVEQAGTEEEPTFTFTALVGGA